MRRRKLILVTFLTLSVILFMSGMNSHLYALNYFADSTIIRKCQDFQVTGTGSAEAWNNTEWLVLAPQGQNISEFITKVKVLYTEKGIYFLYSCEDKKLTSTMKADNLNLYEEDVVELFLWPDETLPIYFEYELSPLNYELPILVPNNDGKFLGWLPWHYDGERKTQHATSVSGGNKESGASVTGWIAEIFIPYALLNPLKNVPPVPGTRWRANMYRIDYDNGASHFSWQETSRSFHEYKKFGTFIFE